MKPLTPTSTITIAALATIASAEDYFPYAKPTTRFQPFHKLDSTSQTIAEELGYLDITWNNFGLAPIEDKGWNDMTAEEQDAATLLGFFEGTWDCFVNHYEQFTWDQLNEKGVQEHYRALGWTQDHWEQTSFAGDLPFTEGRWWDMLTTNEKKAANKLCYFEDNWDEKDMNPNPSFFPHPVPRFRFKPWDELSAVTQNVASGMVGYDEETWNTLGTAVVERNTFMNLDPRQREGALSLGFYKHTWDCFMNHYQSYFWSSFHEDLRVAIETLGWTEDMWSNDSQYAPASENKPWDTLTPEEKAAATRLCYFQETWDDEPIMKWYDYESGKDTAVQADGPVPNDIDLNIFEETGYVGKPPGSVGAGSYTYNSSYRLASSSIMVSVLSFGALLLF